MKHLFMILVANWIAVERVWQPIGQNSIIFQIFGWVSTVLVVLLLTQEWKQWVYVMAIESAILKEHHHGATLTVAVQHQNPKHWRNEIFVVIIVIDLYSGVLCQILMINAHVSAHFSPLRNQQIMLYHYEIWFRIRSAKDDGCNWSHERVK